MQPPGPSTSEDYQFGIVDPLSYDYQVSPSPVLVVGWVGIDRFHQGHLINQSVGGKAFNQAHTISLLQPVAMVSAVGTDPAGSTVLRSMGTIDTTQLRQVPGRTATVDLFSDGEVYDTNPGVLDQLTFQNVERAVELTRPRLIVVTAELGPEFVSAVGRIAKANNLPAVVNLAPALTRAPDLSNFDLVIVNDTEARSLGEHRHDASLVDVLKSIARLHPRVIVTLGRQGAMFFDHGEVGSIGITNRGDGGSIGGWTKYTHPVGAGDAFCAIASLYHDRPLREIVQFAEGPASLVALSEATRLSELHPRAVLKSRITPREAGVDLSAF